MTLRTCLLLLPVLGLSGSLLAQEAAPLQETWLERFAGGTKTGWVHLRLSRQGEGYVVVRESCWPLEGGAVRERVVTDTDARGKVLRRETTRSGLARARGSVAVVHSGLGWGWIQGDLPPAEGELQGGALDLDVVSWLLATGSLPRPAQGAAVRLLEVPGEGIVHSPLSVEERDGQVVVTTPRQVRLFDPAGALIRIELPEVVGGALLPARDADQAADMSRDAATAGAPAGEALAGLSPLGLREERLGLLLRRPGPSWELLRREDRSGQVQLGLRHPLGVELLVQALPLSPPADEEGRRRVGRMLTQTLAAQRMPFALRNPEPATWGERHAIELLVSGQLCAPHLRGMAWAVAGARGGLFALVAAPADHLPAHAPAPVHGPGMAPLVEAARAAVVLEEPPPAAQPPPWKRVVLEGLAVSLLVPPDWEPTPDGAGFAAPGALLRFGGHRAPKLEGLSREAALEILVRRVREGLGGRTVSEQFDQPVGGRQGRRVLLEGQLPAEQGGLATRVLYAFVPEEDGGVTILMGLAVESPQDLPTLERILGSVEWKR